MAFTRIDSDFSLAADDYECAETTTEKAGKLGMEELVLLFYCHCPNEGELSIGAYGIIEDITDRSALMKKMNEELKRSKFDELTEFEFNAVVGQAEKNGIIADGSLATLFRNPQCHFEEVPVSCLVLTMLQITIHFSTPWINLRLSWAYSSCANGSPAIVWIIAAGVVVGAILIDAYIVSKLPRRHHANRFKKMSEKHYLAKASKHTADDDPWRRHDSVRAWRRLANSMWLFAPVIFNMGMGKLETLDQQSDSMLPGQILACEDEYPQHADDYSHMVQQTPVLGKYLGAIQLSTFNLAAMVSALLLQFAVITIWGLIPMLKRLLTENKLQTKHLREEFSYMKKTEVSNQDVIVGYDLNLEPIYGSIDTERHHQIRDQEPRMQTLAIMEAWSVCLRICGLLAAEDIVSRAAAGAAGEAAFYAANGQVLEDTVGSPYIGEIADRAYYDKGFLTASTKAKKILMNGFIYTLYEACLSAVSAVAFFAMSGADAGFWTQVKTIATLILSLLAILNKAYELFEASFFTSISMNAVSPMLLEMGHENVDLSDAPSTSRWNTHRYTYLSLGIAIALVLFDIFIAIKLWGVFSCKETHLFVLASMTCVERAGS